MTIDRLTAESAPQEDPRNLDSRDADSPEMPRQQLELLALEIEQDDFGGDPYNRTGQFCVEELKKRDP